MKMISDAVDAMVAGLKKNNNTYAGNVNLRTTNIRMDVEQLGSQDRYNLVKATATSELTDLIINGDTEQTDDLFLRALDGEEKRGEKCTHFEIASAILEPGKPKGNNAILHTLWMVIYAKFDDTEANVTNAVASKDTYVSPEVLAEVVETTAN